MQTNLPLVYQGIPLIATLPPNRMRTIFLFGNPDLPCDALPMRLLPQLAQRFPKVQFRIADPNELDIPEGDCSLTAIDTVEGLREPREISVGEIAEVYTRATTHDFDFALFILLARKLNPGLQIRILGIPMGCPEESALAAAIKFLES